MNSSPDGTECDENADCIKPIGEQSTQNCPSINFLLLHIVFKETFCTLNIIYNSNLLQTVYNAK